MRTPLVALLLLASPFQVLPFQVLPFQASAQTNQDWRQCRTVDADHLAIPACTRLIEASRLGPGDLAIAYAARGDAHWRQRDPDAAIADANEALKLDPKLARAYVTLSAAYGSKEDQDQSLANASKAIELDFEHRGGFQRPRHGPWAQE